ncbi:MAG: phage tail tube protein [Candidatus Heimdallarchaeota archaeon]
MNNYISGADTVGLFAFEDQDGWNVAAASHTASDETYMSFGHNVEIAITRSNNAERSYGIGSRNATATINKQFAGKVSINGSLANAYWLLGVMGANADAGSVGAYTHTYTETNLIPSFSLKSSFELGTTDYLGTLIGCKVETCKITAAVDEAVKFNLECSYRYETLGTTGIANNVEIEPIFTFAHGSIEMPDGTVIAAVQNFELTITNSNELAYGIGSRFMTANVAKQREYNFNLTAAFKDHTALLTYFMNGTNSASAPDAGSGTEIATLELTFTNDDGDILDINLTGIHLDEETLGQNSGEIVKEGVTGWARGCTNIIYTNDVQTAPAEATNI